MIVKPQGRAYVGLLIAAKCALLHSAANAASGVETAGDILQYALLVTAGCLTLAHRDGEGVVQLGKSIF